MIPLAESFMSHSMAPTKIKYYLHHRFRIYDGHFLLSRYLTSYDPIRIPIIEFSESATSYEESVWQING